MKANYEMMVQTYENLNDIMDSIADSLEEIKKVVNGLDNKNYWEGKAYENFKDKLNNNIVFLNSYCALFYEINKNIKNSAERYKAVDQKVMSQIGL